MSRALSYRQAAACENAAHPRCRCRCRGALHGAARGRPEELPADDPHHAEPDTQAELELEVEAGLELAREAADVRRELAELESLKPQRVSLEREAEIRAQLPDDVAAELDRLGVFRRAGRAAGFDL